MNDSRTMLRNRLLAERASLSDETQASVASQMVDIVGRAMPSTPGTVAAYLPHGGEVDLRPALNGLIADGWRVCLPVCGVGGVMEFCPWTPGERLTANRYGIDEPETAPLPVTEIDVALVPGVGFDSAGSRIGHGVGFYDRYFARCEAEGHTLHKLGVAHDFQLTKLPVPESWDVPMDRILTPTKVIERDSCA